VLTQYANNVGQARTTIPCSPSGIGLTLRRQGRRWIVLPEESGISGEQMASGVFFAKGKPALGIAVQLSNAGQANMPATSLPVALADGSLKVSAVDHLAQEDAWRLRWDGSTEASLVHRAGLSGRHLRAGAMGVARKGGHRRTPRTTSWPANRCRGGPSAPR
jgi:beta-glucosidase